MKNEILHQTKIDYEQTGVTPESNLRITRRGRLALTLAAVGLVGTGIVAAGISHNSGEGSNIPLSTAEITVDHPNFYSLVESLPGYDPSTTNLEEVVFKIRKLNPNLKPEELRPGTQVFVPNLEQ